MCVHNCACGDEDAYVCFSERHNLGMCGPDVVEQAGGPCECCCHYDQEDDDLLCNEHIVDLHNLTESQR